MVNKEINEQTIMKVESINFSGWIPEIHCYGPVGKCSCTVSKIINMINNGIDVILTKENNEKIYLFIKKYNLYLDTIKSEKPRGEIAEQALYKKLFKQSIIEQKENDKNNPLVENPDEINSLDNSINKIIEAKNIKNNKKKTVKGYDIFSDKKVEKPSNLSSISDDLYYDLDYN